MRSVESVLPYLRAAVRRQRPYHVGTAPNVTVKLNQNESPLDLPEPLKHELVEAFFETPFNRYPREQPEDLLAVLADVLDHDPEGLLVGNGSNELTYTLGLSLLDAGTPVVLPRPMFALYTTMVHLYEGDLTEIPPRSDLGFDVEAMLEAIRRVQPGLVVVATPNNPTGLAMSIESVEAVVAGAPGIAVVDEAYLEFSEEPSAATLLADHPNLLLLRTLSKAYGLAGLRLGYLMGHPAVVQEMLKARLPFMVDRLAEQTAIALLRRPALIEERIGLITSEKRSLSTALDALPDVEVLPSQTNFVLFRTPVPSASLLDRLADHGVLVRDMSGYPELTGFLRVNAGTPAENKAFLAALNQTLTAWDAVKR